MRPRKGVSWLLDIMKWKWNVEWLWNQRENTPIRFILRYIGCQFSVNRISNIRINQIIFQVRRLWKGRSWSRTRRELSKVFLWISKWKSREGVQSTEGRGLVVGLRRSLYSNTVLFDVKKWTILKHFLLVDPMKTSTVRIMDEKLSGAVRGYPVVRSYDGRYWNFKITFLGGCIG